MHKTNCMQSIEHISHGKYLEAYVLKDKSVISSIPTCFENKESPIICYKYNKPIRSTVFNFKK